MIAGQDHDQLLGHQLLQAESVALDPLGHRQEGQVELIDAKHLGQLLTRVLAHGQLDAGVALVVDRQRHRDVDRTHRVHHADRHASRLHPAERLELRAGRVDLGEDPPRAGNEILAGVRDRDASRRPVDERQPDLLLEPADLLRQRRLGDVLPRCGPREVTLVGKRDQVSQLAKFHKQSV